MSPTLPAVLLSSGILFVFAWLEARAGAQYQAFSKRAVREFSGAPSKWPLMADVARLHRRLPATWVRADRERLQQARMMLGTEALLAVRLLAAVICAVGAVILRTALPQSAVLHAGPTAGLGAALGLLWVEWSVSGRVTRHRAALRSRWPGFLQRLELCLLAGLPLDRSLRTIRSTSDELAADALGSELDLVLREIGAGVSAEQALGRWAKRSGAEDVQALAAVCHKAHILGVPLAPAIAKQSALARTRLRQRRLAWLTSLPSRISLVAMVFFMPAILVVVLLPSVLAFLRSGW